jgi:mono/diheme cytochrome c family protein
MFPSVWDRSGFLRRAIAGLLILACASMAVVVGADPPKSPPGDAAEGKKIFQVKCVPCHKADGSGGIKLTGNPTPNFRDPKRVADPKYTARTFLATNGKVKSGMQRSPRSASISEVPTPSLHRTFSQKKCSAIRCDKGAK